MKTEREWYVNPNIDLCQKCGYVSYKADNKGKCPNCGRNTERACPECGGEGLKAVGKGLNFLPCEKCGRSGKIKMKTKLCGRCGGFGWVGHSHVSKRDCPQCNGSGKIKEREAGE